MFFDVNVTFRVSAETKDDAVIAVARYCRDTAFVLQQEFIADIGGNLEVKLVATKASSTIVKGYMEGERVYVNNPAHPLHNQYGEVRFKVGRYYFVKLDFEQMFFCFIHETDLNDCVQAPNFFRNAKPCRTGE